MSFQRCWGMWTDSPAVSWSFTNIVKFCYQIFMVYALTHDVQLVDEIFSSKAFIINLMSDFIWFHISLCFKNSLTWLIVLPHLTPLFTVRGLLTKCLTNISRHSALQKSDGSVSWMWIAFPSVHVVWRCDVVLYSFARNDATTGTEELSRMGEV